VSAIVVEDFVQVEGGKLVVRATDVPGHYAAIPIWGGWRVEGNITVTTLAVNLRDAGGPDAAVLIFGVASRSASLDADLGNGFHVRADRGGGCVLYNGTLAGWCLRYAGQQGDVNAWVPAGECALGASYVITVDPPAGVVRINGEPVLAVNVSLVRVDGILPGWLVTAGRGGIYYLAVHP
jgi:hypothetical protein